jgi:alanine racemase
VKIDTGMHRFGFRHDNLRRTLPAVASDPHLEVEGIYTQFATAEDFEHPLYDVQRIRFDEALRVAAAMGVTAPLRHAAKSGALLRDERVWYDAVRPGLLLYGVVPPPGSTTLPLEPVMSLRSRVVAVKGLRPGDHVGYGARYTAATPRRIAVVPAGYADGLDTRLANRGVVLVRERRVPVVGSVCMDTLMLDVTDTDVAPGDEVVIIGRQGAEHLGVREVAATVGTIPWDLLCRLGPRIEREYV